jgi:FHS family glucose/mannose:H+ symporter-like MFS transporter
MRHSRIKLSLLLNFFVLALLLNCVGAVALQAQRTYGIAESTAGLLAVGKSAGILIASALAMFLLSRLGYRRAMLLSLGGLTVVCLLLPFVPGFPSLALLFVVAGASFATIKVAVYATTGLITAPTEHTSFLTFLEGVFSLGIVAGYFLFGLFADDAHPQSVAWLNGFYVIAGLAGAAWWLLLNTPLDETALHGERQKPWRQSLTEAWQCGITRGVLAFGLCVFLYVMVEQSTLNWLPTFNSKVLRLPTGLSIQLAGLLTVTMAAGRLLGGLILRRVAWMPVLTICLVATAALVGVELLSLGGLAPATSGDGPHVPVGAYLLPLIGLFLGPIYPVLNSVALRALPLARHGSLSGFSVVFSALGSSIGTVVVGYWFQVHGGAAALRFTLIPLTGLFVGLFFLRRGVQPD